MVVHTNQLRFNKIHVQKTFGTSIIYSTTPHRAIPPWKVKSYTNSPPWCRRQFLRGTQTCRSAAGRYHRCRYTGRTWNSRQDQGNSLKPELGMIQVENKTMYDELMCIPNSDKQTNNYPFCRLNLLVENFWNY